MKQAIDYEPLLVCLVEQVARVTGLPETSIYSDQPAVAFADQPAQPLFTIHFASSTRYGHDYGDAEDSLTGPRGLAVSFNVFAEQHSQASSLMETWSAAMFSEGVRAALEVLNVTVWSCGQVLDMTEKYDTGFQPRCYMQAMLGATATLAAPVTQTGSIDTLNVTGLHRSLTGTAPAIPGPDSGVPSAGGTLIMPIANASVVPGTAVVVRSAALVLADAMNGQMVPCIGFVIGVDGQGNAVIQTGGILPVGTLSNLTPGTVYFLGANGQPVSAPVTALKFVQPLGTAVSDSQLALHISPHPTVRIVP